MAENADQTHDKSKATAVNTTTSPTKPARKQLPPWKVLLHNDDENDMAYVVDTIQMLTGFNRQRAVMCMLEAHQSELSLLLTTHQERAELYQQQFASRNLQVTIEPTEA